MLQFRYGGFYSLYIRNFIFPDSDSLLRLVVSIAMDINEEMKLNRSIDMFYKWYDPLYSYISFPKEHQRKLHTNNVTERFNKELKRRTRKIGAFPNSNSLIRLVVAIAMDINEEWLLRSQNTGVRQE